MTNFSEVALQGRSQIIFTLGRLIALTPTRKAELITYNAIHNGLIAPRLPIKGQNLTAWASERDGKNVTAWAVVSAVDCLIRLTEWTPDSDLEWAAWAFSLTRLYSMYDSPEFLYPFIPTRFDDYIARKWIDLAVLDRPRLPSFRANMKALSDGATDREIITAILLDKKSPLSERELAYTAFGSDECAISRLQKTAASSDDIVIVNQTVFGEKLSDFENGDIKTIRTYGLGSKSV